MRESLKTGFSFGTTSGVITTLGLMVGLHAGTHSRLAVIGGILTIAIADAFSDALGIHMSEESENVHTAGHIWASTAATFAAKFVVAVTFLVPVLLLKLTTAVVVSVAWGIGLLAILSYVIGKSQKMRPWQVIGEHIVIALAVVVTTHFVGHLISAVSK
jgi:VIT1/CCC1 family predicted Fe2+/Mn2+ transporter